MLKSDENAAEDVVAFSVVCHVMLIPCIICLFHIFIYYQSIQYLFYCTFINPYILYGYHFLLPATHFRHYV